jgi:hypothetical protein
MSEMAILRQLTCEEHLPLSCEVNVQDLSRYRVLRFLGYDPRRGNYHEG